ncbi:DEAD/DEAH box helicase family protein [Desulfosoma caldarium]|uniref:Superfamily II DNA or RNA helicase n=1 Tax=Desulfosoma caldarium TaxID=610254 RepID=A0A3N1VI41_9BACT|nr:DEAD/DEAH box helicase family protein [Desulfosoma caldarium]ROR01570.1 superfamily II DNA or RNA helicase [Desulfosoma caldarium]
MRKIHSFRYVDQGYRGYHNVHEGGDSPVAAKLLKIHVAEQIRFPVGDVSPQVIRKIQDRLVFTNPEYEQRHLRGEWIGGIPAQIHCLRKMGSSYVAPRGFLDQLLDLCRKFQQPYKIFDNRRLLDSVPMEFHGQLKEYQLQAAEEILERDAATLLGGYKSGKTVIALYVIAQRKQPTLVLIPRMDLLEGWLTKIVNFLQIPLEEIGLFVQGLHKMGNRITVAHTAEMMKVWRRVKNHVGFVVLDECQRSPAKVLTQLIPNFDSRYLLGLCNATQRYALLSRFVYLYLGDVVYTINEQDAREGRGILRAQVVARATGFDYPYQTREDYDPMLQALINDEERTRIIANDIEVELEAAEGPLVVVSGGDDHNAVLQAALRQRGIEAVIPECQWEDEAEGDSDEEGEANGDKVCACLNGFPQGPAVVLMKAEDLLRCYRHVTMEALFLAVPLFFKKNVTQALRALLMQSGANAGDGSAVESNGRRVKIYDYVDKKIGLFENYFRMRSYNYGVHPDVLLSGN